MLPCCAKALINPRTPATTGQNELDQIQKIHNIIGTPPADLLAKLKRHSHHVDFSFPQKEGTGIAKLIPHCSADCIELVTKLLAYNPDDRLSARQALRHPYFRELRYVLHVVGLAIGLAGCTSTSPTPHTLACPTILVNTLQALFRGYVHRRPRTQASNKRLPQSAVLDTCSVNAIVATMRAPPAYSSPRTSVGSVCS
jgi:serine/threonine protein kinase